MQLIAKKSDNEIMWLRQKANYDASSEKLAAALSRVCQFVGGVADDYKLVAVPPADEESVRKARHITYDGSTLTIDARTPLVISGMNITVTQGWVQANKRLLADDDFDIPLNPDNDRLLIIEIVEDNSTEDVEVIYYLWLDEEVKGNRPAGKTLLWTILEETVIPKGTTDLSGVI